MADAAPTGFYWSKWLTFSFATLLQLSSGLGYTFSIYSTDLKKHFQCVLSISCPAVHRTCCRICHAVLRRAPLSSCMAHRMVPTGVPSRLLVDCHTQLVSGANRRRRHSMQRRRVHAAGGGHLLRLHEALQLVGGTV